MSIPSASIAAAVAGLFQIASGSRSDVSSIRTTFGSFRFRAAAFLSVNSSSALLAGTVGVVHPEIGRGLDLAREHGAADLDDDGEWVGRRLEGER